MCSALLIAAALVADPVRHSVSFDVKATGIEVDQTVEFPITGPRTDRAYEAFFVTEDSIADIAAAFEKAGIPKGRTTDAAKCRFWPVGERVTLTPDIWSFVRDNTRTNGDNALEWVYTGGMPPFANANGDDAMFSNYTLSTALLVFDGAFDQSSVYGRFVAGKKLSKGEKMRFTVTWDGKKSCARHTAAFRPGNVKDELLAIRKASEAGALDLLATFDGKLTLSEARGIARALATVDSPRCKVNGVKDGELFFRAYLPEDGWRVRKDRLIQPLEVRFGTNTTYTVIDEDWSVEGDDPKLTPREIALADVAKLETGVCFVYADAKTPLETIYAEVKRLPKKFANYYVFAP